MAAVAHRRNAIAYIKNPSEAVCIAAVKAHSSAIHYTPYPVPNAVAAVLLIHHPLYPETPKFILDRAPEILEAHCAGLADIYLIGRSIVMTGEDLSKTMMEWIESHHNQTISTNEGMTP